ncbi:protocatechuate 3,4-dioxygenase [Roseateles sp. DAIF2]|uniref:protocatechuate 3,4-dioxygenase n=1 Tax=Roseateles sp. DAIF2 TaxID=2714952 RepID=UPI0018A30D13|nr:protocatechuate 3,4-dioxygenase [Roseateles sp. DAIF2]QPF73028.1 protocatechuate 3,4-dioxygenase [Roseateles sp. DAIF2]
MDDHRCALTSSQTIGPFPHEAWAWAAMAERPASATLCIRGRLLDGQGQAINDGWIEAWSPAVLEREQGAAMPGFRRVATDEAGAFMLWLTPTGRPGEPAAHITVFARGLLKHQHCALFLADDPGLAGSALLAQVPESRRHSLIAQVLTPGEGGPGYRWDIRLQGDAGSETVFFDYV